MTAATLEKSCFYTLISLIRHQIPAADLDLFAILVALARDSSCRWYSKHIGEVIAVPLALGIRKHHPLLDHGEMGTLSSGPVHEIVPLATSVTSDKFLKKHADLNSKNF